jgi:hypothetical protein
METEPQPGKAKDLPTASETRGGERPGLPWSLHPLASRTMREKISHFTTPSLWSFVKVSTGKGHREWAEI